MNEATRRLLGLDRAHVWHPFTPHGAWHDPAFEPVVIAAAEGATLTDTEGRAYLDGNSSIWTNLHGHRHPAIDAALRDQLGRFAHVSFLGLTHTAAPPLAEKLLAAANRGTATPFQRVFFSDDGSTAMETALKILVQYHHQTGQTRRTRLLSLGGGYHGDTVGAMSLGHSGAFHTPFARLLFETAEIPPPACYRCPHNKAKPEKTDARGARRCRWECLGPLEAAVGENSATLAGFVLEPRVQGAAGFLMHPHGFLEKASALVRSAGGKMILDEVLTGCGRTGPFCAFHHEDAAPDLVALAKSLTGGYSPLAATLVTGELYSAFQGGPDNTFYHGHSYTAHALGCAAASASLDLLESPEGRAARRRVAERLTQYSAPFWEHPHTGDIRQEGTILAIELVEEFATRKPFPREKRVGAAVCQAARAHGLLTRPVGDVLLLMPPLCATEDEIARMAGALLAGLRDVLPSHRA